MHVNAQVQEGRACQLLNVSELHQAADRHMYIVSDIDGAVLVGAAWKRRSPLRLSMYCKSCTIWMQLCKECKAALGKGDSQDLLYIPSVCCHCACFSAYLPLCQEHTVDDSSADNKGGMSNKLGYDLHIHTFGT